MALKIVSKELLAVERDAASFRPGTVLKDHFRKVSTGPGQIAHEFIGTDSFAKAFYERQRYEVDAGRDSEPILYTPLYQIINDPTLPRNVPVNRLGPAGFVFERIEEGGEVKFVTVGQSDFSVPIYQYAAGLEYDKSLVLFNELWQLGIVERQAGVAYNALLNHIHFSPFINYTFTADNQTDGGALTYEDGIKLPEKYLRTIEAAITNASDDTDNPRRGPYVILCATANQFTVERALTVVAQQGITAQSTALNLIRAVIAYNGWTGSRGHKTTTYPGVTAGKAYLIDLGLGDRHHRSYVKQDLQSVNGNPDVSRFILEQTVWDSWFGVYTDVAGSTEEITWPTAS